MMSSLALYNMSTVQLPKTWLWTCCTQTPRRRTQPQPSHQLVNQTIILSFFNPSARPLYWGSSWWVTNSIGIRFTKIYEPESIIHHLIARAGRIRGSGSYSCYLLPAFLSTCQRLRQLQLPQHASAAVLSICCCVYFIKPPLVLQ